MLGDAVANRGCAAAEQALGLNLLFVGTNYALRQAQDILEYQVKHWPPTRHLHVILRTGRTPGLHPAHVAGPGGHQISFHPTRSTSRANGFVDLVVAAARVARDVPVHLTVCDDPFSSALAGFMIRKRFGIPMCVQYMGDIVDNPLWLRDRFRNRLVYPYATWLLRRADSVRVISAANKVKLVHRMGIAEERIFVVPNVKGVERFVVADGSRIRSRCAGTTFEKIVLFVGRLESQKDVATLLRAIPLVVQRHPTTLFVIGGSGSEEARLKRLCLELGVGRNVLFPGFIPPDETPEYFRACDVFVLPSIWEDRAGVLVEALAAGKPVVATNTQGTAEVIQDGEAGFIVEPRSPSRIAERLIRLLGDEALAASMGAAGQRRVLAQIDEASIPARMSEMWEYTAGRRRRGAGPDRAAASVVGNGRRPG